MAVKRLGEQPDGKRQDARVDLDVVCVAARVGARRLDVDAVIPTADEGIVLARLHFARGVIDLLPMEDARTDGDYPKQSRP